MTEAFADEVRQVGTTAEKILADTAAATCPSFRKSAAASTMAGPAWPPVEFTARCDRRSLSRRPYSRPTERLRTNLPLSRDEA